MRPGTRGWLNAVVAVGALACAEAVSAQDIGMTIFNSANTAAINIAGVHAMNATIASQYGRSAPSRPQEPYRWGAGKYATHPAPAAAAPLLSAEIDTSPPVALDFRPDADVTRSVNARFADALGQAMPDRREQIAAEMGSGTLQTQFSNLLASYGYSSRNVADVMTAYLIIAWEVVHNEDATRYINGIGSVHRTMQKSLAHSESMRSLSDAQKQELAETLGNLTMLAAIAKNTLVQRGDSASLASLQHGVRATTEKFGIDIASVRLTDDGFITEQ